MKLKLNRKIKLLKKYEFEIDEILNKILEEYRKIEFKDEDLINLIEEIEYILDDKLEKTVKIYYSILFLQHNQTYINKYNGIEVIWFWKK